MKKFMDENFLLSSETAIRLYHDYAADCPIVDYHCHVSPKEIFEDKAFENITGVWLSGDHYKWRLMRANGVDEYYITGNAPDREKFQKFAEALPKAIGNPMYHWCHLELKKYFGYTGILNADTAEEVWQLTKEKLQNGLTVRKLIEMSNVAFVGTTDDPVDSLEWHKKIAEDDSISTVVAPSFRPDKALNLDKPGWADYIRNFEEVCGTAITNISELKEALSARIAHFAAHGCKASDHGLDHMIFRTDSEEAVNEVMTRALKGELIPGCEAEAFKTELLLHCAREYAKLGWVMQIHYNCLRNPNSTMLGRIGPDTGFDSIGPENGSGKVAKFLDALFAEGNLPKTVLYSLDSGDNAVLDSIAGAFQGTEAAGKIQHGSAWWFNDHKQGMRDQMISLANIGILGNFIGMLTDSRSFLSYTRHEYFRRILCELLGEWVENGEYPDDMKQLGSIAADISYYNAVRYFDLEV